MAKIYLLIPDASVKSLLGIPFSWFAVYTVGGALIAAPIGTLLVDPSERRRVLSLLSVGAATYLLADALLLTPSGRSYAILWPLMRYHPPTPGLYLSPQPGPIVVAVVVRLATRARTQVIKNEPRRDQHDTVRPQQRSVNLFTTPRQRV